VPLLDAEGRSDSRVEVRTRLTPLCGTYPTPTSARATSSRPLSTPCERSTGASTTFSPAAVPERTVGGSGSVTATTSSNSKVSRTGSASQPGPHSGEVMPGTLHCGVRSNDTEVAGVGSLAAAGSSGTSSNAATGAGGFTAILTAAAIARCMSALTPSDASASTAIVGAVPMRLDKPTTTRAIATYATNE